MIHHEREEFLLQVQVNNKYVYGLYKCMDNNCSLTRIYIYTRNDRRQMHFFTCIL